MIKISLDELINYPIQSATDLTNVLKEVSAEHDVHVSQRLHHELKIAFRNHKEYQTVSKQNGLIHGLSVVTDDEGQYILTYYQFHKGA